MNAFKDLKEYFEDPEIVKTNENPWKGTCVEGYYNLLPNQKGSASEKLIIKALEKKGHKVTRRTNAGHDFVVDGRKVELKFGLATDRNTNFETIYNHISINKDWDDILFVCVNGDGEIKSACFSKENLPWDLAKHQQGGAGVKNDDFMISHGEAAALLDDEHKTNLL